MATSAILDVQNAFYIGSYQRCVSLGQKVQGDDDLMTARDTFVFRAYLAMRKYDVVIDEPVESRPIELQSLQRLAIFMKGRDTGAEEKQKQAQGEVGQWVNAGADNSTLLLVYGTMCYLDGNFALALEVLQRAKRSFDCMALTVQIMLRMARVDLARDVLNVMTAVDEEATIVQLTTVWVNLVMGGEYMKEAYYICEELSQKFAPTPLLLNTMAVSEIKQGNYEEAEQLLQQVQEADTDQAEAVANMVVVAQMTDRTDLAERLRRQVQNQRSLTLLTHFESKASEFDRCAQEMGQAA